MNMGASSWKEEVGFGIIAACLPIAVTAVISALWCNFLLYWVTLICAGIIMEIYVVKEAYSKPLLISYVTTLVMVTSLVWTTIK